MESTVKRQIFVAGNIIDEILKAIVHNGIECSIIPDGGGFTITYDDNSYKFLEKLYKDKEKEYDELKKQVLEKRHELTELYKEEKKIKFYE